MGFLLSWVALLALFASQLLATLPTLTPEATAFRADAIQAATVAPYIPTPAPYVPTAAPTAAVAAPTSLDAALAASAWPAALWPTVRRIVWCESRGQTWARNGPHVGLMQVNESFHGPVPADAVGQLNQGYAVYLKQGWTAWACY